MNHLYRALLFVPLVVLFVLPHGRCQAAVEASHPSSTIRLPAAASPPALESDAFSVYLWVHPTEVISQASGIFDLPGLLSLTAAPGGGVRALLHSGQATGHALEASTAPGVLQPDRWSLIMLSYRATGGEALLVVHTDGLGSSSVEASSEQFLGKALGPVEGDFGIGSRAPELPALLGVYGLIAIRSHESNAIDASLVFASRSYLAPLEMDTRTAGGNLNGTAGCGWMLNHSMSTLPINAGAGGTQFLRAAVVGAPVGAHNVHVYTAPYIGDLISGFRAVYATSDVQGFTYRSHRDPAYGEFFITSVPPVAIPPTVVPAPSPRVRQLVTHPRGLVRVMTSSNSRGVKAFDGSGLSPGNYAHGFIEKYREQTAGVKLRPLTLNSGGNPWFGLDARTVPRQSASGTIESISSSSASAGDFARFFTGSGGSDAKGPGAGLFMQPGAFYSLRCRDEPGSLLRATEPLQVETYVLAFPGSSQLRWLPDRAASQSVAGVTGATRTASLDTTRVERVLTPSDEFVGTAMHMEGNHTDLVQVGDACFVASGEGARSISVVSEVEFDGVATRIGFEHPFRQAPGVGSLLKFGAWEIRKIEHLWEGLKPGDPMGWRGKRLEADVDGFGVVAFAMSAYRPDADGYVWGTAGWGGHGYATQIGRSFSRAVVEWMRLTEAQIWLQVPAQQDSPPSSMSQFLSYIREALPEAEVAWLGESSHVQNQTVSSWDRYIIDHASLEGVVGVSTLTDPRNGTHREQFADGQRGDNSHYTQRGNRRLADIWVEALDQGAIDPCPADINYDGSLDVLDLLEFLDAFGARRAWSDVNMDGAIDVLDFLEFIDGFSSGCP